MTDWILRFDQSGEIFLLQNIVLFWYAPEIRKFSTVGHFSFIKAPEVLVESVLFSFLKWKIKDVMPQKRVADYFVVAGFNPKNAESLRLPGESSKQGKNFYLDNFVV